MIILMTRDMQNMEVRSLRFWGIMSLASLVGGILGIPVNWGLVKNKLKHGMGTERALGAGGQKENDGMEMAGMNMTGMNEDSNSHANMEAMAVAKTEALNMSGMNMGGNVSGRSKIFAAALSLLILAAGIAVASQWGNLSMRPKDKMNEMETKMNM